MKIWLVQTGEEMPFDGPNTRLLRTALLANVLGDRGHDVTYINASFNHQQKQQRSATTCTIPANPEAGHRYRSILLAGRSYSRNISVGRFLSHRENAHSFAAIAPSLEQPDIVYCGFPPVELAEEAVKFARDRAVPVVVDCRDMWPDIFAERLPKGLRWVARPALSHLERLKRRTLRGATAITGITDHFVSWGLNAAGRERMPLDRSFHLAASSAPVAPAELAKAHAYWDTLLGSRDAPVRIGCFAGTLAKRLDIITLLDGLDRLNPSERANVRIVLCGKGDLEAEVASRAAGNDSIVFGGWRDRAHLAALMERSDFGILPYPNSPDFLASYPNKVGEYLLAGLPIMTGLEGATGSLLDSAGVRLAYRVGDPDSFADSIRATIAHETLDGLSRKARALGTSEFDPSHIYPAFADWLEQIAARRGQAV